MIYENLDRCLTGQVLCNYRFRVSETSLGSCTDYTTFASWVARDGRVTCWLSYCVRIPLWFKRLKGTDGPAGLDRRPRKEGVGGVYGGGFPVMKIAFFSHLNCR